MNLFEKVFPQDMIPLLIFEEKDVVVDLPNKIWITDTTFRDGQQSRAPFSVEEIVDLFKLLHDLDNGRGIVE